MSCSVANGVSRLSAMKACAELFPSRISAGFGFGKEMPTGAAEEDEEAPPAVFSTEK